MQASKPGNHRLLYRLLSFYTQFRGKMLKRS